MVTKEKEKIAAINFIFKNCDLLYTMETPDLNVLACFDS